MTSAKDVALLLIDLANSGEESDPLTNLRLQKLLYYVQGWSLALRSKPAFDDRIEAWPLGPVVPTVYHSFKHHEREAIPHDSTRDIEIRLDEDDSRFISEVWSTYQDYSASKLVRMTHQPGTPWDEARLGYAPGEKCHVEITKDSMKVFFDKNAVKE